MHKLGLKNGAVLGLILLGAILRILPHSPNFTAIGAMALMSAIYVSSPLVAMAIPLASLFISDLVLGFHPTMIFVYAAFAIVVLVARSAHQMAEGQSKWMRAFGLLGLTFSTSAIFFVISNFGVWLVTGMYPMNAGGLIDSYIMALPFLDNQILGDLFYTVVAFSAVELAQSQRVKSIR